ncbi:hypothetical protein RJ639_001480 [Escallonia herrerae]|uniref:Uncharacterized protein n=1 Tax=Escallonia herrerae TaxID=1293975 RepID=A0AA89BGP4_9ASTE|nr:hypothetical protein RJ639_001480 [Escallonia herrerae]
MAETVEQPCSFSYEIDMSKGDLTDMAGGQACKPILAESKKEPFSCDMNSESTMAVGSKFSTVSEFEAFDIMKNDEKHSLTPLMVRSLVRFMISLVGDPAASVTTILYYSDLLPQNFLLMRYVRPELLGQENYLFNFLINLLRFGLNIMLLLSLHEASYKRNRERPSFLSTRGGLVPKPSRMDSEKRRHWQVSYMYSRIPPLVY